MERSEDMNPILFAEKFGQAIRVGFNWDRFITESWPVEAIQLRTRDDLAKCFMPWYIGKKGEEVAYDDPDAVPMCLLDVPKSAHILNEGRQADIEQYVNSFKIEATPIEFSAPTYSLPGDKFFVLDRNHRLSALALISVPFNVTLWNVRGPQEPDGLLDFRHWLPVAKN